MRTWTAVLWAAAGLAGTGLVAADAGAADFGSYRGSIKDEYRPMAAVPATGNCYVRADVGYSGSADPDVTWPVTDAVTGDFIADHVRNINFEDTWFAEGGIGCGTGHGFRGEIVVGYHGDHKYDGEPPLWQPVPGPFFQDPLHTSITSYTLMLNGYKDLGTYRGFTPYVGAGIGVAYNIVDDVYFTENPALTNQIRGGRDIAFAWSLMAGVGYQLTSRATVDVGYRYIDFGKAASERSDTAFFVNPRVNFDDLAAHEVKVGLRYNFGAGDCCAHAAFK